MTLRSQAIVIRDETAEGANTHLRVGNLLVEMADAIAALGGGAINSASYITGGGSTVIPSADAVPVFGTNTPANAIKTGSGITVDVDGADEYSIFSGLDASHAYGVIYNLAVSGSEAARVEFVLLDAALSPMPDGAGIAQNITTSGVSMCLYSATFSGQTDCVLGIGRIDSVSSLSVTQLGINARIIDLGVAV